MRLEILFIAALAALASAAPQWPYRDAVAPYYYGYPGKTPYMYRAEEDDEMEETSLARQDLKVATSDGGSTVVIEDDEKADGVRVVETGSAKPVAQLSSNNNNQVQQDQQQQQPAAQSSSSSSQAQQPLNNNGQQTSSSSGQPLTVQQPGQQPPQAFPPARPNQNGKPQQRPAEEEDEEEDDDEDSEEDDEEADEEDDDGDDDDEDEDEEDDEDRRRNIAASKQQSAAAAAVAASADSGSGSEEPAAPQQVEIQNVQNIIPVPVNSEVSDEVPEEPQQPINQQAVVINKVIKNKQSGAAAAAAGVAQAEKPKKKLVNPAKTKNPSSGAIEALVPGYVTDQGEVLVPVDTVTGNQPITIVPDPFSPPSRIVAGPRPIPQGALRSTPRRQVPFWYRSGPTPAITPAAYSPAPEIPSPLDRQTLYSAVPPPGSIFTFDDDDDDDDDTPSVIPGQRLRQDAADDDDDEEEDEDEEADQKTQQPKPQKVPLAAVPAVGNSNEDDEAEALAFVNSGKPTGNRRPQSASSSGSGAPATGSGHSSGGNKKPAAGANKPGSSDESESKEDQDSDEQEEEEEEDEEEEDEEDDSAAARRGTRGNSKARMYVDEEYVSFPPSRSPTLFAVIQGRIPYSQGPAGRPQQQVFSTPNPNNPFQRYVVRVTPANRAPRPPVSPNTPLYYRPLASTVGGGSASGGSPNRRVVQVASFDVSVEDTRPSEISAGPSSIIVDSEEEGDSYSPGRPTPVTSYPFVYKVQGSLSGFRPSGLGGPGPYGGSRPPRPSGGPRPGPYGPYGPPPYGAILNALYGSVGVSPFGPGGPPGPRPSPHGHGPPRPSGISGGPPVIIRKKPSGGSNRPPKPHLIAVYNPTGPSGPGPREPIDEEYYTFEVPEPENKLVPGQNRPSPSNKNKRPTVHRKPTPVIKQKQVQDEEENSDESAIAHGPPGPPVMPMKIIPHGTVRRRIRGGKQLKTKKNAKKTYTSSTPNKKQQQQEQHDPLGLLSKINKSSKSKLH